MSPTDLLARLTDPHGEVLFDRLADWPTWLPSALSWLLVGLAVAAVALAAITPAVA